MKNYFWRYLSWLGLLISCGALLGSTINLMRMVYLYFNYPIDELIITFEGNELTFRSAINFIFGTVVIGIVGALLSLRSIYRFR